MGKLGPPYYQEAPMQEIPDFFDFFHFFEHFDFDFGSIIGLLLAILGGGGGGTF